MEVTFKDVHGNEVRIGSRIKILKHFNESFIGLKAKIVWDEKEGILKFKLDDGIDKHPFYQNFSIIKFELSSINCEHNMVKTYEFNIAEIPYHCTKCDHIELI